MRAVRKWIDLHKTDNSHQNYFARALPSSKGPLWTAGATPDKDLLPQLNRYCYRCHSSLRYNVFDRPAVVARKGTIKRYLNKTFPDDLRMPQDRILDKTKEIDPLVALIEKLQ